MTIAEFISVTTIVIISCHGLNSISITAKKTQTPYGSILAVTSAFYSLIRFPIKCFHPIHWLALASANARLS